MRSVRSGISTHSSPSSKTSRSKQTVPLPAWTRSLARRLEAYIENQIERKASIFLKNEKSNQDIAPIGKNEIILGDIIGKGSYAEIQLVRGFRLAFTASKRFGTNEQESRRKILQEQMYAQNKSYKQPFVIKHLKTDLVGNKHHRSFRHAAVNLVLEAKYLSRMDHPNIVKLRGWNAGGTTCFGVEEDYFLILDRIDETLIERIEWWKTEDRMNGGCCESKEEEFSIYDESVYSPLRDDLYPYIEKMNYALQIARALEYMHERNIVYRDLKPCNIGFKGKDTLQLFDFGTVRELPKQNPSEDETFRMSAVGTRRYMAPEVFLGLPYNVKADVHGWAIVFHQMLSLQRPYDKYNADLYGSVVCEEGLRPTLSPQWPREILDILQAGWSPKPNDRPSMSSICRTLEELVQQGEEAQKNNTNMSSSLFKFTSDLAKSLNRCAFPSTTMAIAMSFWDGIE